MSVLVDVPFLDLAAMNAEVSEEILHGWRTAVQTSGLVGGPAVAGFEAAWADYCGTQHAIGVGNGTDAIELILQGLGIGQGAEVIVPANTFIATVEAILAVGAVPHFVDVLPDTLLIDPQRVRTAINERTEAVIAVHLYGQVAAMDELADIAARAGIVLIEDAAQAHGATRDGRRAGSFGRAAAFSFYPGKNLGALGDGGAVVTDDPALAEAVRSIADHGRGTEKYSHARLGRNSRLDAVQAIALSAKLPRLDHWNGARRRAHAQYCDRLAGSGVRLVEQDPRGQSVFHLEVVLVPDRERVAQRLRDRGIGVGFHYPTACHQHPAYRKLALPSGPLDVVEQSTPLLLSLPMFPHLRADQIAAACDSLIAALDE
ncbi:MAG: hypothetical protein CSA58_01760 [Micrococcales bacterium]|nr:MAG: hypothetical protein CSA58_01760 [Micrococcales bacterium]